MAPSSDSKPPPEDGCVWSEAPSVREHLAAIIDHVAHPIFVKDRSFRFVMVNRALAEMAGFARADMLGKTDYDFFPRSEADFFRKKDREMFATGSTVVIDEEPITDGRGERHILATTKVPLHDGDGTVTHVVGIVHDITRLKRAEEALRLSNEELERRVRERTDELARAQAELIRKERLAVLGELAGGVAHQVRNPLGSISNAVAVARRAVAAGDDPTMALDIISEEVWRANRIISDLIGYARVRTPRLRRVDVRDLVARVLAGQEVDAAVRVVEDLPELPPVRLDVEQAQGAVDNLVRNALEAMPEGGTLTVRARQKDEEIVLTVEDTGPGVDPEIEEQLFEPLVTTKTVGLGLGLTTTRALLESQGGRVDWESEPGRGARFHVRLPIAG